MRGNVGEVITEKDQRGQKESLLRDLDLEQVLDRNVENLSGGELQRFAIAVVAAQEGEWRMGRLLGSLHVQLCAALHIICIAGAACPCVPLFTNATALPPFFPTLLLLPAADVYMIDEPSSYLDVRQRLKAAEVGAVGAAAGGVGWTSARQYMLLPVCCPGRLQPCTSLHPPVFNLHASRPCPCPYT